MVYPIKVIALIQIDQCDLIDFFFNAHLNKIKFILD